MIPLVFFSSVLPKYDKNCAWGKAGEIKKIIRFRYLDDPHCVDYYYSDLTDELILKSVVTHIMPVASGYRGNASAGLLVFCKERNDDNA